MAEQPATDGGVDEAPAVLEQARRALINEGTVRIEISNAVIWNREANTLTSSQSARVYRNAKTGSGRARWVQVGIPFYTDPDKPRSVLLRALADFLDGDDDDPVQAP